MLNSLIKYLKKEKILLLREIDDLFYYLGNPKDLINLYRNSSKNKNLETLSKNGK